MGSRGLVPLGCLPHWGREGVTLAISTQVKKTRKGFLQSQFFTIFLSRYKNRESLFIYVPCITIEYG